MPGDLLHFCQRPAELFEIAIGQRGQQGHEHQVRNVVNVLLGRLGQSRERLGLIGAADARWSLRHDHDASP